jgi:hypothetical protein
MPELPRAVALVTNPHAGRAARLLGPARAALVRLGLDIAAEGLRVVVAQSLVDVEHA